MELSRFGEKFTAHSGILDLMDDMGRAMAGSEKKYMLGGGNPAHIPEMNKVWRRRMEEILSNGNEFERMVANYDTPAGRPSFLAALAEMFRDEFGWPVTEKNIVVTNGSQSGFYLLLNMLSGEAPTGGRRKILFPLLPEYIGYADQGLDAKDFVALKPRIEIIDDRTHKYHIDFDTLEVRLMTDPEIAAICVSRPTNPSGNVLTDTEIHRLDALAREHGIPLLLDNAYGTPFPDLIFQDVTPIWNENTVVAMSLSKIGLPGVRTGIMVAGEEMASAIAASNAVLSLANGSVGQVLVEPMLRSGELLQLSREVIRPYYLAKSRQAQEWVRHYFGEELPYSLHKSEGSLFLWLWFKELPITTRELYRRLKERRVIVVPGEYFFFGSEEEWDHRHQCIRLNYSQAPEDVEQGIALIAEEVRSHQLSVSR
ncbi:MAG: valine--pyruvate transaminase [Spirochaetaceae bacterium]